jgi:hypothetical protein
MTTGSLPSRKSCVLVSAATELGPSVQAEGRSASANDPQVAR